MARLEAIGDGVYAACDEVAVGPGVRLPVRMTVLATSKGLLLVSPIALDDALAAEIDALGTVHALVGPNCMHHAHLAAARQRYPEARLLGAPGLADKRNDLPFDAVLESGELPDEVEALLLEGADALGEVALWHRPSRTLVLTDAAFNVPSARGMSWFVLKVLSGVLGRFEQSRLLRSLTRDRAAAGRSAERMLQWPIERVVVAHGDVVSGPDARERLGRALWWWRGQPRATG